MLAKRKPAWLVNIHGSKINDTGAKVGPIPWDYPVVPTFFNKFLCLEFVLWFYAETQVITFN
jgi:hypothetical protein